MYEVPLLVLVSVGFLTCFVFIFLISYRCYWKEQLWPLQINLVMLLLCSLSFNCLWQSSFLFEVVVELNFCKITLVICILFNSTWSPDCDDYTQNDVCLSINHLFMILWLLGSTYYNDILIMLGSLIVNNLSWCFFRWNIARWKGPRRSLCWHWWSPVPA